MNTPLRFIAGLWLGLGATATAAQTLDPAFQATELTQASEVEHVMQQADGKLVVSGGFVRANQMPVGPVVRYHADYSLDHAFNTNAASLQGMVVATRQLPSGKLLVIGEGPLKLGSVTRQDLLRLNSDGTPDPGFNAGSASVRLTGFITAALPNDQLLVAGNFTDYNGSGRNYLVRLLANGSIDNTFSPLPSTRPLPAWPCSPTAKSWWRGGSPTTT
ncbi:delta-60 repeat domain-containing protein [Hymenobacter sp. B81]|uniref:delta-60 repeat domain-containing protein n=1 Tax=Hymenobacter sp. B81 TaxID=3344878 RepID=UPI0037DDB076